MKKLLAMTMTVVLCIGMMAGCGSQKEETEPAGTETAGTETAGTDKVYHIGICQLVEHPALDAATEGFQDALKELLGDSVTFDVQNAQGEQTNATTICNAFVADKVDLILANATSPLQAAASATADIPILGTSVTDYATALYMSD